MTLELGPFMQTSIQFTNILLKIASDNEKTMTFNDVT